MASGIYQITIARARGLPLVYVGQSVEVEDRRSEHARKLAAGTHENYKLQAAWNKHRKFDFILLEPVTGGYALDKAELYWWQRRVKELGKKNVLNILVPGENSIADTAVRERHLAAVRQAMARPERRELAAEKMRQQWAAGQRSGDDIAKTYPGFVAPDGTEYRDVKNLAKFCREHGLNQGNMMSLVKGNRQHVQGWRLLGDDRPLKWVRPRRNTAGAIQVF